MKTLAAAACLALTLGVAWADPAPVAAARPGPVDVRTQGALRFENVPQTPPAVRERLRQYVNTRAAGFLDFLPDGGILIATRFGNATQVHRVAQPMGARTQLTFFDEPVGGASVRPGNGDAFLFARDAGGDENFGGFLQNLTTGQVNQFTTPGTRNQSAVWRDDGQMVAWAQVPAASPNYDIMIADPAAPAAPRRLLQGEGAVGPLDFSADGSKLLIGQSISVAYSRRFILDVASGALSEITPDLRVSYDGGEFTPDGRAIILTSDEGSEYQRLVRIDLTTGARTVLTPNLNWDVESFDQSRDGRRIALSVNEAGQSRLSIIDARAGRTTHQVDLPPSVVSGVQFDDAGRRLGFTVNAATAPGDAYTYDLRSRQLTRWTQSEVGGLDPSRFVAPELVTWTSFDGREISGFYYRPASGGNFPVIVSIHGGPEAQSRPTFSSTVQYWVNELGVAVLVPNVRGSSGYGRSFLALDNAEKREDSVRDIGAALDWIAARPELDDSRVAVYGGSYGGYMVLASMVHFNDRLAGGVNIVGISNFVTFLENTSGYRRDLRRVEYGDERDPAMRATLERISPLSRIHEVSRPLLVIHGANDPRVPLSEAEQVAAAVRENRGEVWTLVAADEGHGFAKRPNQEAQREAETLFFQRIFQLNLTR
ncbi:MAG: prolyl oligopeptidase family serine peptidase [Caulobacterales bacterium]